MPRSHALAIMMQPHRSCAASSFEPDTPSTAVDHAPRSRSATAAAPSSGIHLLQQAERLLLTDDDSGADATRPGPAAPAALASAALGAARTPPASQHAPPPVRARLQPQQGWQQEQEEFEGAILTFLGCLGELPAPGGQLPHSFPSLPHQHQPRAAAPPRTAAASQQLPVPPGASPASPCSPQPPPDGGGIIGSSTSTATTISTSASTGEQLPSPAEPGAEPCPHCAAAARALRRAQADVEGGRLQAVLLATRLQAAEEQRDWLLAQNARLLRRLAGHGGAHSEAD